jgi:glycerophosphoryl diester phosphodiesterase
MMPSGPRFLAVAAVGLAVLGLGLYLYVRWSLAVPGLCLEGLSLKRATKRSAERTRAHFWPVARGHLLHHAVIAFLLGVASFVIGLLGRPIIQAAFDRSRDAGVLAVALLLVVAGAVFGAITLFGTARLVALMTIHHRKLGGKIAPDRIVAVQPLDQEQRQRLRYLVPGVLVILAATVIITLTSVEEELERTGHVTTVTAHRGSSIEAPQNSMAALLLAIDDGADACEFDVHQGKDGALVVIHDAHLQKLTGVDRHVYDMTLDELVQLDVGSHHDPKFASERLPTLEQYLRAAKGKIKLNVELKVHGKEAGDYAGDVIDLLRREGMLEDSYITSLDAAILRRVRKLEPTLPIGMIITAKVGDASNLDCDIYSVQPLIATSDFVNRAHREDREVHVWTINDAADMNLYADRNADSLITDLPRLAREVLEARTPTDELKAAVKRLFDVD